MGVEKSGAGVAAFSGWLVFDPSLGVEGFGAKRLPKALPEEGSGFCSVKGFCSPTGLAGVAGFGAKRLLNGFSSAGLALSCSALEVFCSADGLGANKLPVDGGWNRPLAGANGAAELALFENKDGPPVEGVNWKPVLG